MMLETAETKFVEARGTKYAYRSIGNDVGNLPLVSCSISPERWMAGIL